MISTEAIGVVSDQRKIHRRGFPLGKTGLDRPLDFYEEKVNIDGFFSNFANFLKYSTPKKPESVCITKLIFMASNKATSQILIMCG